MRTRAGSTSFWSCICRITAAGLLFLPMLLLPPRLGLAADEPKLEVADSAHIASPGGQPVPETELRDDRRGEVTLSVQSLEDVMKVLASSVPERLEANIQPLTASQAERWNLHPNQGVVIIWLDPKGPLGRTGLATSDIILQVENQPVESVESFVSRVNSLGPMGQATFTVLDHRTGRIRDVRIAMGTEHRAREDRGNFVARNVGAAVAGIQRTAQSLQQQINYALDASKEAITDIIRGLKRWAGVADKAPVAATKKGEEGPSKPSRQGGPG